MKLPHAYQPITGHRYQGPFVVLEGVSGIGKSTLAGVLAGRLRATSIHTLTRPHTDWSAAVNARLRALPQFAFYLSGLLHTSDSVRQCRTIGPVIADRYVSSVLACHSAVHRVPVDDVAALLVPYRGYLDTPDLTFYLRCSEQVLRRRMETKGKEQVLSPDDLALFGVDGRLDRLLRNFERVADEDPTAVVIDTDGKTPGTLADEVLAHVEARRA
ncbi:dTMP kinase [Streptomyces pactum]|uniref:dTMP kinase n=1 Tax=Streptomyces pactum TaxID=68249 RepID=UPI0027DD3AF4|nr:AAA family ATPase [Streptomyces pactum]